MNNFLQQWRAAWRGNSQLSRGCVWVFCDGSTGAQWAAPSRWRGVPTTAATHVSLPLSCAAAAIAHDDAGQILDWRWQQLPEMTNNEAEYAGLILGLEMAHQLRASETICVLDSEVVAGQMDGRCAVNSHDLRRWHGQACAAARRLPNVRYRVVPREFNRLADGLAGQAAISWPHLRRLLGEGLGIGDWKSEVGSQTIR